MANISTIEPVNLFEFGTFVTDIEKLPVGACFAADIARKTVIGIALIPLAMGSEPHLLVLNDPDGGDKPGVYAGSVLANDTVFVFAAPTIVPDVRSLRMDATRGSRKLPTGTLVVTKDKLAVSAILDGRERSLVEIRTGKLMGSGDLYRSAAFSKWSVVQPGRDGKDQVICEVEAATEET